ncbi:MAG: SprT family zinc-dependent metalloprotease [Bacilli bacterium]|nr:SprT family zinc-dependent metalloprotease [Bacilli bacterium]
MKININGQIHDVVIIKKRGNKNIYMRVKEDMNLHITSNLFVSDKKIEKIIEDNIATIEKMYNKQIDKKDRNNDFYYLGDKYDIVKVNNDDIEIIGDKIFVGNRANLDKWIKKQAEEIFLNKLDYYYSSFSLPLPKVSLRIRKMKSRWGVCNTKTKIITLNLELIKRDITFLDYVINHELSHLIHPNHSKDFWNLVSINYPNYKEIRKMMKKY